MRKEYISLSIAGAFGLFFSGVILGGMLAGHSDAGTVVLFVMLLVLVRGDMRESIRVGEYKRGWFVWRRIGPAKSSDDHGASA